MLKTKPHSLSDVGPMWKSSRTLQASSLTTSLGKPHCVTRPASSSLITYASRLTKANTREIFDSLTEKYRNGSIRETEFAANANRRPAKVGAIAERTYQEKISSTEKTRKTIQACAKLFEKIRLQLWTFVGSIQATETHNAKYV